MTNSVIDFSMREKSDLSPRLTGNSSQTHLDQLCLRGTNAHSVNMDLSGRIGFTGKARLCLKGLEGSDLVVGHPHPVGAPPLGLKMVCRFPRVRGGLNVGGQPLKYVSRAGDLNTSFSRGFYVSVIATFSKMDVQLVLGQVQRRRVGIGP